MNKVTSFEIVTTDIDVSKDFYSKVFDWSFKKVEQSPIEYWLVLTTAEGTPGAINGGMRKEMGTDTKQHTISVNAFICTIDVESIDDIVERVQQNGGKVLMPKTQIPQVGFIAACLDWEGNAFNLQQSE